MRVPCRNFELRWNDALINNVAANGNFFQFHHQPFAYYMKYAPFKTPPTADYSASTPPELNPATTGPKAHGPNNKHPGYADLVTGQQHVADLVAAVQKSKIWKDCVIIITYDENGGRRDHAVPRAQ